jgi:hypothetical protein
MLEETERRQSSTAQQLLNRWMTQQLNLTTEVLEGWRVGECIWTMWGCVGTIEEKDEREEGRERRERMERIEKKERQERETRDGFTCFALFLGVDRCADNGSFVLPFVDVGVSACNAWHGKHTGAQARIGGDSRQQWIGSE